MKNAGV